jgi:hypothetical protein
LSPRLRGAPALARWAPKSGSQSPPCAPSSRPSSPRPPAPWPAPGLRSWQQVCFLGKPWGFPWLVHVWDVYPHGSSKNEAQHIKHSIFFNNFKIMQAMLGRITAKMLGCSLPRWAHNRLARIVNGQVSFTSTSLG